MSAPNPTPTPTTTPHPALNPPQNPTSNPNPAPMGTLPPPLHPPLAAPSQSQPQPQPQPQPQQLPPPTGLPPAGLPPPMMPPPAMGMPMPMPMSMPPGMPMSMPPGMPMPPGIGMPAPPGPPPGANGLGLPPGGQAPMEVIPAQGPPKVGRWIYVGGFGKAVSDAALEQIFGLAGSLLQWKGAMNPLDEQPLGFGFAEFESLEDASQAVLVLNGLKIKGDGDPLVAKMDKRDSLNEPTEQQQSDAETIKDKVNFFIQNFSSTLTAPSTTPTPASASTKEEEGDKDEDKDTEAGDKMKESKEGEDVDKDKDKEAAMDKATAKKVEKQKQSVDAGKNGVLNGLEYSEDITEEEIQEVVRLEPRPADMADEIWDDIVEFRNMQARHEILNDRKRKQTLLLEVKRLRGEIEKERLEKEKEEEEKLAEAEALKQKEKEKQNEDQKPKEEEVEEEKNTETEVIDYSLKKDMSFGALDMKFETKKTKKAILTNEEAEEEESKKRRKLVPLEYTEEERAAARTVSERIADVAARISQTAATEKSGEAAKLGKILEKIKELVTNYIGEAEESLVAFVYEKVNAKAASAEIEAGLRDVLDDDAVEFVKQLNVFIEALK